MPTRKDKKKTVTKRKSVVDVRSAADLPAFEDLFKKNNMVIVLVYADYCGHCHTYKDEIWNNLQSIPNKHAGLGSIHYDQVENTALANVPLDGYPSVLLLGKDQKPAEFKDPSTGKLTNSLPEARDAALMKSLLTNEPTNANISRIPSLTKAPNTNNKSRFNDFTTSPFEDISEPNGQTSLPLDMKATTLRNRASTSKNLKTILNAASKASAFVSKKKNKSINMFNTASVPNTKQDVLDTQHRSNEVLNFTPEEEEAASKAKKVTGGSLYASLLQATRDLAPAAILTTAAVAASSRKANRRGARRRITRRRGSKN